MGSRRPDIQITVDRIADVVPDGTDSRHVFDALVLAAQEWAPAAASVDLPKRGRCPKSPADT